MAEEYIKKNTIAVNFIKKEAVNGSYEGMRYRLTRKGDDFEACIWPEPYNYFKTKDELKQYSQFPLNEEGKDACVDWMNEQIEVQAQLWKSARETPWV